MKKNYSSNKNKELVTCYVFYGGINLKEKYYFKNFNQFIDNIEKKIKNSYIYRNNNRITYVKLVVYQFGKVIYRN